MGRIFWTQFIPSTGVIFWSHFTSYRHIWTPFKLKHKNCLYKNYIEWQSLCMWMTLICPVYSQLNSQSGKIASFIFFNENYNYFYAWIQSSANRAGLTIIAYFIQLATWFTGSTGNLFSVLVPSSRWPRAAITTSVWFSTGIFDIRPEKYIFLANSPVHNSGYLHLVRTASATGTDFTHATVTITGEYI